MEKNDASVEHCELGSNLNKTVSTAKVENVLQQATASEHELTVREALIAYKPAVLWSLVLSTAVIMEGYDTNLLSNFFAYPSFLIRYGH